MIRDTTSSPQKLSEGSSAFIPETVCTTSSHFYPKTIIHFAINMSDKLIPKNAEEVMVIREIAPGITTLSVPFLRFGLIKFGGRATIGAFLLFFYSLAAQ